MRRRTSSAYAASLIVCSAACGRVSFEALDASSDLLVPDALQLGPACPADPRLLACYDFESNGADRSGHGNDATLTSITFVPSVDGSALHATTASRGDLATPSLDSTRLTVEAWVRADQYGATDLVFDHDSRWAMGFQSGVMFCNTSGVETYAVTVPTGV
jgi:hypothetical protein